MTIFSKLLKAIRGDYEKAIQTYQDSLKFEEARYFATAVHAGELLVKSPPQDDITIVEYRQLKQLWAQTNLVKYPFPITPVDFIGTFELMNDKDTSHYVVYELYSRGYRCPTLERLLNENKN